MFSLLYLRYVKDWFQTKTELDFAACLEIIHGGHEKILRQTVLEKRSGGCFVVVGGWFAGRILIRCIGPGLFFHVLFVKSISIPKLENFM